MTDTVSLLPAELRQALENALKRLAHLEALALLFHAITGNNGETVFGEARDALNRDFPEQQRMDEEIARLAGQFSAAYQDGVPCPVSILDKNPLLIAAALGKQLGESFLSSSCTTIPVMEKRFHAFRAPPSLLQKDWTSPRRWFQTIWFVASPSGGKDALVSHVNWHDGANPTCALIEFDDKVGLDMKITGDTFIVRGLADEGTRWNNLVAALRAAQRAKAQILVLPELSLTPALLEKLSGWLLAQNGHPFRLIAAGSYHHLDTHGELARNRMTVLDRRGETLFHHDKWFEFSNQGRERICTGKTLQLLLAPPGLLSFAICKDFCEADGFDWKTLPLDGLCVASMGGETTLTAHRAAARTMKLSGARVLLANNTEESDGAHRGFFSLPDVGPRANEENVTLRPWNIEKPQLKIIK